MTRSVPLGPLMVSEILGHSSIAITGDVDAHVAPVVSRDTVTILGAVLGR